jgi:arylsulfatase A-like enzyme
MRALLLLQLLLAAAAAAAGASAAPNMVFILSDDLGFSEPSFQPRGPGGNRNVTTPNIDALARSGMVFTDAYCGEAVCAPSRNSLMTGQHTGHTWIRGNLAGADGHGLPLRANDTTFFELLRAQGYHVACVGKWSMGWWNTTGAPDTRCSEYFGVVDQAFAHNMYPSTDTPDDVWRYPASDGSLAPERVLFPTNVNASRDRCMAPGNDCMWDHDQWTGAALRVISAQAERERAAREAGGPAAKPLFLYLAYTDPHAGGWSGEAEDGNPVPSDDGPARSFSNESSWPFQERDHASVISNFQDADVGRIVALLESTGLRSSTAVFFASDNGASDEGHHDYMFFESSGPLRGFKRCLTEGGIRTPFVVSWPGTVPAGSTTNYTIAFWDMMPTAAELAGVPKSALPAGIDGVSFAAEMRGQHALQAPHPPLYWEFCTNTHPPGVTRTGVGWAHAMRNGTWSACARCVRPRPQPKRVRARCARPRPHPKRVRARCVRPWPYPSLARAFSALLSSPQRPCPSSPTRSWSSTT